MSGRGLITSAPHTNKSGAATWRPGLSRGHGPRSATHHQGARWGLGRLGARGGPRRWHEVGLRTALRGCGLVVANSMRAAFLTALVAPRRTRLVYWVRDGLTDSAMSPLALALTKHVTARRVSHYVANSQWTAGTVRDALGIEPERIDVVHSMSGVTEQMLDRPPRSEPHTPLRLLFLGRISPWKAPDVAIRALARLRERGIEATLTIAGGSHFGEDRYAAEVGVLAAAEPGVTLLGHLDDVQGLLGSHDVLVHCSIAPEPFGQVVVQANARGLPAVATNHGGIREIVRHGVNGLLYQPGDEAELANVLRATVVHFGRLSRGALDEVHFFLDGQARAEADLLLEAMLESDEHVKDA